MGKLLPLKRVYDPKLGPPKVGAIRLHRKQVPALLSKASITLIIAGIRGGKTHVGALKTILYAMEHPTGEDEFHGVGSPTFRMSKVPVEKMFKLLYDKRIFPICPLINYRRSERIFELAAVDGGITRIMVGSLHDPDRWRGIKLLSLWLDEGAYTSHYAWDVMQGRLADSNGPCWITTTPAGYNWVYEIYEQGLKEARAKVPLEERKVRIVHWNSLENTFNKKEGIVRLAERYDAKTHAQEVEAKFIKMRGLIYHAFNRKRNIVEAEFNKRGLLLVGQDFNVDPMSSVIGQLFNNPEGKEGFQALWERKLPDSDTYSLAHFLTGLCLEIGIPQSQVILYPDASGKARSTTGKSDFRILREAGFKVVAPARNPSVKDRINTVNGLLKPLKSNHTRIRVHPRCEQLIESLEKQIWAPDTDPPEPDKSQGYDHLNDALGYLCWSRWPLRAQAGIPQRKVA